MNISPQEIPDGMDYQLINVAVAGDVRFSELAKMEQAGWRRVPVGRHPKLKSSNPKWIEQGGLALVERPKYLTDQARKFEQAKADAQVINAVSAMAPIAGSSTVIAMRVNGRELNPKAPSIVARGRQRGFKEFFVFHFWRLRFWVRSRLAS